MRAGGRRLGLLIAAIVVAALAWYAPPPASDGTARPVVKGAGATEADPARRSNPRLSALPERAPVGAPRGEMFAPHSWAPPVQAAAAPPQAPSAPPNPYRVAGTMIQDGAASIFLVKGDRIYDARPGVELDGGYRVESISADQVVLVYLPLGIRQALPIGPSPAAEVAIAAPAAPAPRPIGPAADAQAAPADRIPAKAAQMRWEGPQNVRAGAVFSVGLHVSSDQQLRATSMQLRFEPELLEPLNVRAGKFFDLGTFSYRMNPDGTIFVGAAGRGAAPGADAELVVLTFRPRRGGATAQVSPGAVALQDPSGRELALDAVSAFRTAIQ